jgi:hypothetical protein
MRTRNASDGFDENLGVFEAEGHEDVVPLALEVVLCDRSARSKLVEVVEPGHDLRLVDRFGTVLVSALLASFALGNFAVVALSGDASLVCAVTHLESDRAPPSRWPRGVLPLTLTIVVDMTAHALDRLQLPRPVHVVLAGIGANSLGQTVQTRQLLVSDLLGVCRRQTTHRPPERLLSVSGAFKTQFSADPRVGVALAAKP